jgi:sterol desaturase/sphingolipid hydroxylase (fatty acid hydroxylase superfamily)
MFVEDTFYYFGHKLLHTKYLYAKIHKIHHRYIKNVSIAAEYSHPIEFIFVNLGAITSGVMILNERMHAYTFLIYIIIRNLQGFNEHCGYNYPWAPSRILPLTSKLNFGEI